MLRIALQREVDRRDRVGDDAAAVRTALAVAIAAVVEQQHLEAARGQPACEGRVPGQVGDGAMAVDDGAYWRAGGAQPDAMQRRSAWGSEAHVLSGGDRRQGAVIHVIGAEEEA